MIQNPNETATTASSAIFTTPDTFAVSPTIIPEQLTIATPDVDLPISAPASAFPAK